MIRFFIALLLLSWATPLRATTLDAVLGRMDAAAASFQSLTANLRVVKYTAIVADETVEEGSIWVRRVRPRVNRFLIEFSKPDRYYVAVSEHKAEIYRPRIATIEEYDIARYRDLGEQLWPFGASGKDLAARYNITLRAEEPVAGQPAVKLEMVPKDPKLLQQIPKVESWISTATWQPVQQKFYDVTPGDYRLSTYTDVKLNVPVPDSRLRLPSTPGAKRIQPLKN
jgi:outer membrane lipoprotein-sorting protein